MAEGADFRSRRRNWTRAEIVAAGWELARREGVAALSLRELANRLGMRAPSLYTYFPSKNDLYDAMFAQGMREFSEHLRASAPGANPRETLRNRVRTWAAAAVEDPFRYELLFQRPIPGFVPSPDSLAIGLTAFAETRKLAAAAGLFGEGAFDLFIATTRGLVEMQMANEPDGDRWVRLVDEAVDIYTTHYASESPETRSGGNPSAERDDHAVPDHDRSNPAL
ncbi:MAG: TetR/AcrR family transcriptional regulator [Acidimicrobiales bacterium]